MEESVFKQQLLYEGSRNVLIPAGPSSQVAENIPRVRELGSQIMGKRTKRVGAVALDKANKRELVALLVWCAKLDSETTRLHSKVHAVKKVFFGGK